MERADQVLTKTPIGSLFLTEVEGTRPWIFIGWQRNTAGHEMVFVRSIKGGDLTANQLAAVTRSVERKAAAQAQRAAAVQTAPVIDMTKIEAAFASAAQNLKAPKLRVGKLVISPAKATSANAGALYVKSRGGDGTYFGKIVDGKFIKSRDCDAETEELILKTATDPEAAAVAYGRETGTCSCCGAELTNKLSIELGIGPICREKWGM